jgi:hypothetical protein
LAERALQVKRIQGRVQQHVKKIKSISQMAQWYQNVREVCAAPSMAAATL